MRICDVVGGIGLLKILFAWLLWEGGIRCNDFSIIGQCFALQQKFTLARKLKVILLYQPSQTRTIPRKSPTPLPPLSKGGGLTARHKLLLCCFLLAICPLFLYCKLFCRQDGGIALHHRPFQNRTIPRKRGGSVARSSRANYGGDCSCLEVVSLIPLVVSLFHIDRCIDLNSEPEKCYLAKRTIGSLLS